MRAFPSRAKPRWTPLMEITKMYLYGASGHAKVVLDVVKAMGQQVEAIFDDNREKHMLHDVPVLHEWNGETPVLISIGDNATRKRIAEKLRCDFIAGVHPSAIVSSTVSIDAGTVVMQGAIIQSDSIVGKHCIINTGASIDHECRIADFVHISPHATLCGNVQVGEGTRIGAGSVVIPGVHIGKWCVIGAGSVVLHDIPDGVVVYGNPCEVKRKNLNK